ncbi:unnamed protein product [Discula destructiva]
MKTSRLQSAFGLLLRPRAAAATTCPTHQPLQIRCAHKRANLPIPSPVPFVPDVKTFLTLIGRGLGQHTAKFPTWEALFSLTSSQLKELGIEPPRTRRYLIHWRDKYRLGYFGPGGDIKHVQDGVAKLAIEEIEDGPLETYRRVYNIPFDKKIDEVSPEDKVKVDGYKARGHGVSGPSALPMRGEKAALVSPVEGMWEHKRGRKVNGGERRRKEVLFKKHVEERKAQREALGFT